jgi:flavin reductase
MTSQSEFCLDAPHLHNTAPARSIPQVAASDQLASSFRSSMRRVAATVAIITARSGDQFDGMTATAVTSVSTDPPTILVCVNRKASISPTLSGASNFCVNFLCNGQEEISRAFSDSARRAERFGVGRWIVEEHSPPHIEDAQATLFCRRISEIPFETHTLFLGRVYEVRFRDSVTPLVYLDGCYRNIQF